MAVLVENFDFRIGFLFHFSYRHKFVFLLLVKIVDGGTG